MFSQILIKFLGLFYKLYLTNKDGFGDSGNAIYSSGYQIYALLLTLSSIGVPSAIAKLVSERLAVGDNRGAHRVFKVAFVTFALLGLFGTCVLFCGAEFIATELLEIPEAKYTLVTLSPSIFFVAVGSVFRGYFNGREQMNVGANSQTIEQVFKTFLTILIVEVISYLSSTNTVMMAVGANLATSYATFLGFAYLSLYYENNRRTIWKDVNTSVYYKTEKIRNILKKIIFVAVPVSITSLLYAVSKNIDSFTVVRGLKTFMTEAMAKQQYGILSGKIDTLTSLPLSLNVAFSVALVPAISTAIAKADYNSAKNKISYSLLLTNLIAFPCAFGMFAFAEQILNLLFPNASSGALILKISSISIFFAVLAQTVNGALQGLGKVIEPAIALSIGVTFKLILNILLVPIPEIGVNGAAFGTVMCHAIACAISFILLKKHININIEVKRCIIKPIVATIMMTVCSSFLYTKLVFCFGQTKATVLAIVMAIIIYIFSVVILKIFEKDEILMLPFGKKIYRLLVILKIYEDAKSSMKSTKNENEKSCKFVKAYSSNSFRKNINKKEGF